MRDRSGLIRLRTRPDAIYASRNVLSLATDCDGFIEDGYGHVLFVHETRMLWRYRWLVDGESLTPVARSTVEQHTWLGHYIRAAPGNRKGGGDEGIGMIEAASEYTLELQLRRTLAAGVREEVRLTNYTQQPTAFRLTLEADADFADLQETAGVRVPAPRSARRGPPAPCESW